MPTCRDRELTTPHRVDAARTCVRCGEPLKQSMADYRRLIHIRCLLQAANGWALPQGRPHYVW